MTREYENNVLLFLQVKNFDIQVIRGFPRDVLTERAEAVRPSALIMGSRGLGTMQR